VTKGKGGSPETADGTRMKGTPARAGNRLPTRNGKKALWEEKGTTIGQRKETTTEGGKIALTGIGGGNAQDQPSQILTDRR